MKPSVNAQYYRMDRLPGIEVARVSSSHCFPRHFHQNTYSLGLVDTGASYCLGKKYEDLTSSSSTALINPGQIHTGMPLGEDNISYRMIYISREYLRKLTIEVQEKDRDYEFTTLVSNDKQLRKSLDYLADLFIHKHSLMEIETAVITVLAPLLNASMSDPRGFVCKSNQYRYGKEIIESDLGQPLSLEDVSSKMGMSRFQFLRGFKRAYGITPHAYRQQLRLEWAAELIRKGNSLINTALETGFTDQSHFSKSFKTYYGATPNQYSLIHTPSW